MKNGYVDAGDCYWYEDWDGLRRCCVCSKPIEHDRQSLLPNHHCSLRAESARQGASTRSREPLVRKETLAKRLADGFAMMDEDYEG